MQATEFITEYYGILRNWNKRLLRNQGWVLIIDHYRDYRNYRNYRVPQNYRQLSTLSTPLKMRGKRQKRPKKWAHGKLFAIKNAKKSRISEKFCEIAKNFTKN